jgi:DNA-binding XRE family transcriptional regulator
VSARKPRRWENDPRDVAFYRAFGGNIRRMRLDCGMTLPQLADAIGITRQCLWLCENGRQGLNIRTLAMAADALSVNVDELLPGYRL